MKKRKSIHWRNILQVKALIYAYSYGDDTDARCVLVHFAALLGYRRIETKKNRTEFSECFTRHRKIRRDGSDFILRAKGQT